MALRRLRRAREGREALDVFSIREELWQVLQLQVQDLQGLPHGRLLPG